MKNKKVAFLVPIHPPHFHYARGLMATFEQFVLNIQSDLWFIFTNEEEQAAFGEYPNTIVLPENLRIFENSGIINIKKFHGLQQIQDQYEYIIVLDAESLFIKTADIYSICKEYFENKILLGNEVLSEGMERTEGIKNSCKKYFENHPDFEKLNNPLYLWFNQPCIYKTSTLNDFWNKINYNDLVKHLQWADFDYYIYMFYLILFQGFRIEDTDIKSNYGICEVTEDFLFFKSNKYESLPIFMASQSVLHKFDNPKCFIAIHLDRNKDWMLRVMTRKIDYLMQQVRELKKEKDRRENKTHLTRNLATYYKIPELDEISFVIQGEINHEIIPVTIENIRHFFPGAEIVIGTYVGMNTSGLDYDKIALCEDPGFYPYDDQPGAKENNVNRQIQTTLCGLRIATRKYAFKIRSDFVLTGSNFLEFWKKFPAIDPNYGIFEHKVLSCVFFARNPRAENPLPFHPSDIAFFGLRTDLLKLFDIPLMTEEESIFYEVHGKHYCKYVPEQHIWVNCLRKYGKKIKLDHQRDASDKIAEESEKYTVSNFVYLDWQQFNLMPPKRLTTFTGNDFHSVITHIEWQKLYQKYLDNTLVFPKKDSLRNLIDQKTILFRFYKLLAKLATLFFPTKRLKNFRKNIRKRIIERLSRNACIPN